MLRNIKILVSYDGTDFAGYQRQGTFRTVQGEIEAALEKVHKAHITLTGAGRTDSGVHATGQVCNFYTSIDRMAARNFIPALNSLLPRDIRVLGAEEVPQEFHARFSAKMRHYRYQILCGRTAYPHEDRYIWQIWRGRPDIRTLNAYAAPLHGELNCSLFATPNDPAFTRGTKSPCRYITRAAWHYEADGLLIFNISANAFLWKMVRCIVGSLLYYEEKNMPLTEFAALLAEGDHRKAGPTAPAKGLFLTGVDY